MAKRWSPIVLLVVLLLAAVALLLACSGAEGDPAPLVSEAGTDAGVVIVNCADGATP